MSSELSADDARRARLDAHLLGGSSLRPTEVVDRAIAMQGQDLPAVLRAIAIRSRPGTTIADVRAAFDAGELVRSWPMRGTLFATTPGHLAALLAHTADRTLRSTARRREALGLEPPTIDRAWSLLRDALLECPRRRAEALELWDAAGLAPKGGRGYHLLMHLSVSGRIHWGPFDADTGEHLLQLTAAAPPEHANDDASLTRIVRGYLTARGPATDDDVAWWTKLPKTALRRALAEVDDLVEVDVEGVRMRALASALEPASASAVQSPATTNPSPGAVTLVPAFDEWVLGYGDRSLIGTPAALQALVPGSNGVFRPAVLVDGRVVGVWRMPPRSSKGARAVEVELLEKVSAKTRRAIDDTAAAWSHE